jgi:hypothetical protein
MSASLEIGDGAGVGGKAGYGLAAGLPWLPANAADACSAKQSSFAHSPAQSHSVAELHFGDNERFFNLVWGSFTGSFGTERAAPALLRSLCFFQTLSASCHFR